MKTLKHIVFLLVFGLSITVCASLAVAKNPLASKDSLPPIVQIALTWKDSLHAAIERAAKDADSILAPEIEELMAQQRQAITDLAEMMECFKKLEAAVDSINNKKADSSGKRNRQKRSRSGNIESKR